MLGASRESMTALEAALDARLTAGVDAAAVSADLLNVASLLDGERSLRATLADPGQPIDARRALAGALLGDRISAEALGLLDEAVGGRWSSAGDLVEALQRIGASAAFAGAEAAGRIDAVEDELFRIGRIADADGELALTLDSSLVPAAAKQSLLTDLIGQRSDATTQALLAHFVAHPRGRSFDDIVGELTTLAAQRRGRLLAEVTAAIALSDDQQQRLAAVLERIYGRPVDLQVAVDPSTVGGVVVRVGDEIIDGSTATRLEQARRRVVG